MKRTLASLALLLAVSLPTAGTAESTLKIDCRDLGSIVGSLIKSNFNFSTLVSNEGCSIVTDERDTEAVNEAIEQRETEEESDRTCDGSGNSMVDRHRGSGSRYERGGNTGTGNTGGSGVGTILKDGATEIVDELLQEILRKK